MNTEYADAMIRFESEVDRAASAALRDGLANDEVVAELRRIANAMENDRLQDPPAAPPAASA